MSIGKSALRKIALFFLLTIFILNPYTKFGVLAFFLVPLLVFPFLYKFRGMSLELFFLSFILIFISIVGVGSSFVHGIGQLLHLKASLSIVFYVFFAHALFVLFFRGTFELNDFLYCVVVVVSFNSAVLIFEVYFPAFRSFVESFLAPSGNVDWAKGFRYRGIASGGGASLSVLIPVSMVILLHLYSEKYLKIFGFLVFSFILIFSVLFIGRTGVLLLPLVAISYIFFNSKKYFLRISIFSLLFLILVFIFFEYLKSVLISRYGVGFYNYSIGFLFSGSDGLKAEGTIYIIIDFLKVMPKYFPEVLIGYGFYGGSEFEPWTDSGYSRMFLSVGYLFGTIFYVLFFLMFRGVFSYRPFLFITIGALLLISEAKEPLLFTGYSARLYILILVLGLLEKKRMKQDNLRMDRSTVEVPSTKAAS